MVGLRARLNGLYPFEARYLDVGRGGSGGACDGETARLHYIDEGPRDAPVLLLVHGNPTWSFYWRRLVKALRRDFRLVACDHLGCGLSDKPAGADYGIRAHIDRLHALVEHLELDRYTLVVHDWGGAIGLGCALRRPERVEALVVFNTAAFPMPAVPALIRLCRSERIGGFLVRRLNLFQKLGFVVGTARGKRPERAIRQAYMAPYDTPASRLAIHRFVQEIPVEAGHPNHALVAELDAGLARFRGRPMLIVWGEDDFCFTVDGVLPEWRRRFPDAEIHVLAGAGHFVVEEAQERVIPRVAEFLERKLAAERENWAWFNRG